MPGFSADSDRPRGPSRGVRKANRNKPHKDLDERTLAAATAHSMGAPEFHMEADSEPKLFIDVPAPDRPGAPATPTRSPRGVGSPPASQARSISSPEMAMTEETPQYVDPRGGPGPAEPKGPAFRRLGDWPGGRSRKSKSRKSKSRRSKARKSKARKSKSHKGKSRKGKSRKR